MQQQRSHFRLGFHVADPAANCHSAGFCCRLVNLLVRLLATHLATLLVTLLGHLLVNSKLAIAASLAYLLYKTVPSTSVMSKPCMNTVGRESFNLGKTSATQGPWALPVAKSICRESGTTLLGK
jgi:hypothetical protein